MTENAIRRARKNPWRPKGPWITARKIVQYLSLLLFFVLFIATPNPRWPETLLNFPLRVDPLIAISHMLSSRTFLLSSSLALILIISAFVVGRGWCGWLCPLGTILDLFSLSYWKAARPPAEKWRGVKYGLLLVILIAALFGNLTLLIFDPLTILIRSLSISFWPAVNQIILAVETALYRIHFLAEPISKLDGIIRPAIFPSEPTYYRNAVLFAVLLAGIIALNILAPRFWCRYVCPLGALLGIPSKFALLRRQVSEECKGCTLCEQSCPTGTIDAQKGYASDPSECTLCLDCLEACPRSKIAFNLPGVQKMFKPASWNDYDPSRRQALIAFGATLAGLALLKSAASQKLAHPFLLRPPGAGENNLIAKCVRCGECMRACPTAGLQPAVSESGLEGFWTPVLVPRLGYCDHSCNACGQICPVQAIPPLNLEDKRQSVIGKAYIDQNRCIAWADHTDCIVCEEMCPVAKKAIHLQEETIEDPNKGQIIVKLPYILRNHCIGCGICEYKCPVSGEAAVRVYTTDT
jgi:polyferredoxin